MNVDYAQQQKEITEPVAAFNRLSLSPLKTHQPLNVTPVHAITTVTGFNASLLQKRQFNNVQLQSKSQSLGNLSDLSQQTSFQHNGAINQTYNQQSHPMLNLILQNSQASPRQVNTQISTDIFATSANSLTTVPINVDPRISPLINQSPTCKPSNSDQSSFDFQTAKFTNEENDEQNWRRGAREAL